MALNLFNKKNGFILIAAMMFALYQFSKHRVGGQKTGSYQLEKTKKMLTKSLDLWKYELIDGKNNRDEALLLILSREGKANGKQPVVLAEIVSDKRLARRKHSKRHGSASGRSADFDPRARRRKSAGARKGGSYYGKPSGPGRRRKGRNNGGRRQHGGPVYDGPPLLRLQVYDPVMLPLQEMLQRQGFIEQAPTPVNSPPLPGGSGRAGGADGATDVTAAATTATKTLSDAERDDLTKQEKLKRERKEMASKQEEGTKVQEQTKKQNEEIRKLERKKHKKQQQEAAQEAEL